MYKVKTGSLKSSIPFTISDDKKSATIILKWECPYLPCPFWLYGTRKTKTNNIFQTKRYKYNNA